MNWFVRDHSHRRRSRNRGWLPGIADGSDTMRLGLALSIFAVVILSLSSASVFATWSTDSVALQEGEIADRSFRAPSTATFVSEVRTQERRDEAAADSRNIVLRQDETVLVSQQSALENTLQRIDLIRDEEPLSTAQAVSAIQAASEGLSENQAGQVLELGNSAWARVQSEAARLLEDALSGDVRSEDVASVRDQLAQKVDLDLSATERSLAVSLSRPYVRANVQIDETATEEAREAAAAAVEPVMVTVQSGQVIVRDGDPVTRYDIEELEYFGLLEPEQTWEQFLGIAGLLGLVTLALALYLGKFASEASRSRKLFLIGIIVAVPVITGRFVLMNEDLYYMFPAAGAIMLLAILIDFHVAVVVGGFLGLYLGIVSGTSFEIAFVTILSSVAGAAVIWRAERTVTFLLAGLAVMVTTFVGASLFELVAGQIDMNRALTLLINSAVNGALSASLTFLFFSLLGTMFGITTHLQLLELAHPNQPLLYRLSREAPGTYHHSIVVSNLAESAAEQVGGDPLFARVAVMYHDVGKLMRPTFFIENQANQGNVHDSLDPRTSAKIILDHVTDGVRLARKQRLPKPIVDIIQQHHGTSLVKYFYNAALKSGEEVDEADFRYSGPIPQTREAGIVLLADGVEATVRSMAQSGKLYEELADDETGEMRRTSKLEPIVAAIIRERIEDGQLDDCDLTIKQIEEIREIFVSILEGVYHPRIEYPASEIETIPASTPEVATAESR